MICMPLTFFAIKVALASLLIGFFTGWHGLFHVSVWGVVAIVPALVLDFCLAMARAPERRHPAK